MLPSTNRTGRALHGSLCAMAISGFACLRTSVRFRWGNNAWYTAPIGRHCMGRTSWRALKHAGFGRRGVWITKVRRYAKNTKHEERERRAVYNGLLRASCSSSPSRFRGPNAFWCELKYEGFGGRGVWITKVRRPVKSTKHEEREGRAVCDEPLRASCSSRFVPFIPFASS
jgi:hypothetical protein